MKKVLVIIIFYSSIISAQETSPSVELFFGTTNASGGGITFTLSNQSQVWGVEYPPPVNCNIWEFYTTSDFNIAEYEVTSHNQPIGNWAGLDFSASQDNNGFYDIYGYGLYKISTSESNSHFYIDYRDQRIGCYHYGEEGAPMDLWIKYDASNNTFYYNNDGRVSSPFYSISNSEYLSFWSIKDAGRPETDKFPDFWEYALALIPSQSGNHPKLVWGPHPDDNIYLDITGYNIYRAIDGGSFSKIDEVNENTFAYTDTYFTIGGSAEAHYKVTANYQDVMEAIYETSPTNITSADVSLYKEIVNAATKFNFQLIQNYPNPFNPTTKIRYSISEESAVNLKVFDILGREIKTIVNEIKTAGSHEVEFDASSLTNGIYIYQLRAGNFSETRKMLLVK